MARILVQALSPSLLLFGEKEKFVFFLCRGFSSALPISVLSAIAKRTPAELYISNRNSSNVSVFLLYTHTHVEIRSLFSLPSNTVSSDLDASKICLKILRFFHAVDGPRWFPMLSMRIQTTKMSFCNVAPFEWVKTPRIKSTEYLLSYKNKVIHCVFFCAVI